MFSTELTRLCVSWSVTNDVKMNLRNTYLWNRIKTDHKKSTSIENEIVARQCLWYRVKDATPLGELQLFRSPNCQNMRRKKQNNLIYNIMSTEHANSIYDIHHFLCSPQSALKFIRRQRSFASHTNCRHRAVVRFNVTLKMTKKKPVDAAQFDQLDF